MKQSEREPGSGKPPPLDDRLAVVFAEFGELLHGHFQAVVAEMNLTPVQALVLRMTGHPTRMGVLATRARCQPSHITGVVDELEGRGWLERGPDPADRRAQLIRQTESGAAIEQEIIERLSSPERHPLRRLTDEEKRHLLTLLTKAIDTPSEAATSPSERDYSSYQ